MNLRTPIRTRAAPGRRFVLLLSAGLAILLLGLSAGPRASAANTYSSTLYLSSTSSSLLSGSWQLVSSAPSSANLNTQNRIQLSTTGYQDFQPGFIPAATANTPAPAASASTTPNGKGWLVDGGGAVTFAGGTWTFNNTITDINNNGVATLAVGMWKVTVSGNAVTSSTLLVDPNCTASPCGSGAAPGAASPGTNFVGAAAVSVSLSPSLPSFSLSSNEHLYVQYWRWQTTGMSSGGNAARLAKFSSNDGTTSISHPSANSWPDVPTLGSVAARTRVTPQLSTTYSDTDTDNGTVSFQLCSDSACSSVLQSNTTATVASGTAVNWTPAALADGTYYWRAQSTDAGGNTSGWSATNGFVVDTTSPTAPTLGSVAARTKNTTPALSATFSDPDGASDTGTLSFQLCSTSGCGTVLQSGSSASGIANAANGTWTPAALSDGTYYWRAQAQDAAGNLSSWTSAASFVVDTTAPSTPTLSAVPPLVTSAPTLSASFSDPDAGDTGTVTVQLCNDAGCTSVVGSGTSPWQPSGLADGTYDWRARAQDTAGNQSAWSATSSFTLDAQAPSTPTLGAVATWQATTPQLSATFSDPDAWDTGTLQFQLCTTSACTTVLQSHTSGSQAVGGTATWTPASLADGTYFFRARAQDSAGNLSSWSAAGSFDVDSVAPTTTFVSPANAARVNALTLKVQFGDSDAADTGTVNLQLCSDAACTALVSSGSVPGVAAGANATWTPAGMSDGTYYWRASAQDQPGNTSAWSATRSLVLDTTAPSPPALSAPADGADLAAMPSLSATFADGDAGDTGTIGFQLCGDAACASVVQSGTSASGVANGSSGSWTPLLGGGSYYWRAAATDAAGNVSAWSAIRSFTVDSTPPTVPAVNGPLDGSRIDAVPTLTATFSDSGAPAGSAGGITFELCRTSTCATVDASTTVTPSGGAAAWLPAGLADGTYYWRARAADAAGNTSSWSAVERFTLDTTAPSVATTGANPSRVGATPTFAGRVADASDPDDAARINVEICADAACASVLENGYSATVAAGDTASWQSPALTDGTYYWRMQAEDVAGNRSAWTGAQTLVVDTSPPSVPALLEPADASVLSDRRLSASFTSSDAADIGKVMFQVCSDPGCDAVVASGLSSTVAVGSPAVWSVGPLRDGRYFWRAQGEDVVGNSSGWSATRSFDVMHVPLSAPTGLLGGVRHASVVLRWQPPRSAPVPAGYVVFVNGRRTMRVRAQVHAVVLHARPGARLSLALAAIDRAGNVGRRTRPLVVRIPG